MAKLKKPDNEKIEFLIDIVGKDNANRDELIENYCRDETPGISSKPSVVLKPSNENEIAEILKFCNENLLPVVPRGLGTGVTGGSIPFDNAVLISLERMNKILEIDTENLMLITQPAVITGDIHSTVEDMGLFYPPDPASTDSCSIGGNVSTNAAGMRAVKYGVTRDYVKGIRAVTPTGDIIKYGGKLVKNVAGYDLLHTLVGSEGTLAIITEITLKLLPLPAKRVDLLVGFESVEKSTQAVTEIIKRKMVPTAIEFIEGDIIRLINEVTGKELPMSEAGAQLIISLEADTEDEMERRYFEIGELTMELGAIDVLVADNRPLRERLWETRRSIRDGIRTASPIIIAEDVAVPRANLSKLWKGARDLGKKYDMRVLSFGHAGDGNLHIDALKDDMRDDEWESKIAQYVPELLKLAVDLDGTITAEHGIGKLKRQYLPLGVGKKEIEIMGEIKRAFDPNGILNPDKAF